ncbi:MAG TPA: T9SS type A sorting domain-containing protein [Candidatus Acidoferrales bacterium]|nr:T9SS type A sorting domain-containing protein [Candidatus Acidoferrales bacterium]
MKKVLLIGIMVGISLTVRAQSDESSEKGDAVKLEKPYDWELRNAPVIPAGRLFKAESQTWVGIGPTPMNFAFYGDVSGRITSLAVDPNNSDIVYAAAAGGGLWKSTDGGSTWSPLTDNLLRLSSGSVAVDPTNSSNIYYGTGELNFNIDGYPGAGVWKSTDGGGTWSQVMTFSSSGALYYTGKIIVASNGTVYAAGYYDVYKSTNGGQIWTELHLTDGAVDDIAVDPANPNLIYASYGSTWSGDSVHYGIYKSTNGGTSWTWLTSGLPPSNQISRISLAMAPSNNQVLYAFINGNKPSSTSQDTNRVYTSTNGGASWTVLSSATSNNGFGGNQGWYNNVIGVDPTHPDTVYIGGIDFWKSTNGGQTWTNLTNGYGTYNGSNIHVDQHAIAFASGNGSVFYIGNDGGVWKTSNGASTFTDCNTNLQTIQFYDIDADQGNSTKTVGGTQDNGTESDNQPSTTWNEIYGGDGGYVLIDPKNSNIVYTEYVNGQLFKSTDGGNNFSVITAGISEAGYWLTPYVMDPVNDNLLYCGTSKIYKSTNGGSNWTAISSNLKSSSDLFTTMSISPVEGSVIYAGISGYRGAADTAFLFVTINGGSSWNNISGNLPSGTNFARVTADPTQKGVAYIAVLVGSSYHVMRTTNYGATWTGIASTSNGFDDVPTKVIAVDSTSGYIYAGTYWSVYRSTDNGASWSKFGSGLPNAVDDDIAIQYSTHTLRVGTHGRGAWQVDLTTGIAYPSGTPDMFALNQNYPNPFNPSTVITYQLSGVSQVTLKVYDVLGREVSTLVNEKQVAGGHSVRFDGSNIPSGVYFYRLIAGKLTVTKKMVLLR